MEIVIKWNHNQFVEQGIAVEVGITPAIVLQEIIENCTKKREFTAMTLEEIQENISFITVNKIQYSIKVLEKKGFLEVQNQKRDGKRINAYKVNNLRVMEILRKG
jgi:SOS-response transcriptional repressor LexA